MDKLKLIRPNKTFETATLDYKKEHFDHHESIIYGSAFLDKKSVTAIGLNNWKIIQTSRRLRPIGWFRALFLFCVKGINVLSASLIFVIV
ncbi:MAG: hypothetical protein RR604_06540 [Eubacterium sp.]